MITKLEITKIQKQLSGQGDNLAPLFDVLGERNRFKIFQLFLFKKDLCVTDIANILNISVPATSQHLKVLERSRIIECEKRGQSCCYKIRTDNEKLQAIIKMVK
jgi:ArsR family transcriptional regulator, arsenate/arsenite/antimonite-responsive transcriptional repressor